MDLQMISHVDVVCQTLPHSNALLDIALSFNSDI